MTFQSHANIAEIDPDMIKNVLAAFGKELTTTLYRGVS